MKKAIAMTVVLVLCIFICSACGGSGSKSQGPTFSPADEKYVQDIKRSMGESQARRNGDTYCANCDKFIEGKVRICPYCGKYIR